jgi:NAD(P)H-hydrate epimerase
VSGLPLAGWWDDGDGILLPPSVMAAVDRAAIAGGTPGTVLMERAGRAVARIVTRRFPPQPVTVLCGPGNNGGDGYVAARILRGAGWPVRVQSLVDPASLTGDAAWARAQWPGTIERADGELGQAGLLVDALFGGGLARDLDGPARALVQAMAATGRPIVAVDVPSGVDAGSGAIRGAAAPAAVTVTFCRARPGHVLLPGRELVGQLVIADIGIPDELVTRHDVGLRVNAPVRWRSALPIRTATSHKYRHGHALVIGGPAHATGACRVAARAALRSGAGLVTVACASDALATYAGTTAAVMTRVVEDHDALDRLLADDRITAVLIGPAAGVGDRTLDAVTRAVGRSAATVLDADALTSLAAVPAASRPRLHERCVITPHEGEFARLFCISGDRLSRARAAAAQMGCVVLLKGADTVIAAPDGRASIQPAAPASLATAGTGDVLAGIVVGLAAQRMPVYEAACAAAWLHAAAAEGRAGLIADDLPDRLGAVLAAAQFRPLPEGVA